MASEITTPAAPRKNKGGRPKKEPLPRTPAEVRRWLMKHTHLLENLGRMADGKKVRCIGPTGKVGWWAPDKDDQKWAMDRLLPRIAPNITAAALEVSGPDGGPIQSQQMVLQVSERIASVFATAATNGDRPVAETLDDESLRAVQAVSFLQAQAEAANGHQLPASSQPVSGSRGEATEVRMPPGPGPAGDASLRAPEGDPVKTPIEVAPEPEPPPVDHTLSFVESDYTIVGRAPQRAGLPVTFELHKRGGRVNTGPFEMIVAQLRRVVGDDLGAWLHQAPRAPGDAFGRADQGPTLAAPPQVHRGHSNRKRRRS